MANGTWGGVGDPRVFRVNIAFKRSLQNCQTGFHIRDVGINTLDPDDVVDAVVPWANTQFIKTLADADDLVGVDVVNLVTREGASHSFSAVHGTQVGQGAPSFMTVPVTLKGSIRRRYGNGRMLWPVGTEGAMLGNVLDPAAVATYQAAIDDMVDRFMDDVLTATMRLVHLHEAMPARGTRPAVPRSWYDITSIRLNTQLSSLRSRKVGVGS